MSLSDKELNKINRHCVCGKANSIFSKYYKWRYNSEKHMTSSGKFFFCENRECPYIFSNFIQVDIIKKDLMGGTYYYRKTGTTVDFLSEL